MSLPQGQHDLTDFENDQDITEAEVQDYDAECDDQDEDEQFSTRQIHQMQDINYDNGEQLSEEGQEFSELSKSNLVDSESEMTGTGPVTLTQ